MAKGFTDRGLPVEVDSDECGFLLDELNGRPVFRRNGGREEAGSIYSFGTVACMAMACGFDWAAILEEVPDPATEERFRLRDDLLGRWDDISDFIADEINVKSYSFEAYAQIVELFSRLYPAHGHFLDKCNFLSDNFYSFEPDWRFQTYHTAPDFRTMVEEAFGVYRKDLAREVAKSNGSTIALFSSFSSSVTSEELTELFRTYEHASFRDWSYLGSGLSRALEDVDSFNRLNRGLRIRLIHDLCKSLLEAQEDGFTAANIMEDALVMLRSVPEAELKRFRSDRNWDQVHSRAVELASDEDVSGLEPLSFPAELEALDGQRLQGTTGLKLLRTPLEYLQAGSSSGLANCMGSAGYYTKAKNGQSYCLVGYSSTELTLGIELAVENDKWKVLQLSGPGNRQLKDRASLQGRLIELLAEAKEAGSSKRKSAAPTSEGSEELKEIEALISRLKLVTAR